MTRDALTALGAVSAVIVLAADQVSKYWVLHVLNLPDIRQIVVSPVLNLTMVWNQGVTFGMLNGLGSWSHIVLAALARKAFAPGRPPRRIPRVATYDSPVFMDAYKKNRQTGCVLLVDEFTHTTVAAGMLL